LSQVLTEDLDIQEALDGVAARARVTMDEAGYYTWN
jgi:multiple sugar transport system substrate-binding protein